MYEQQQSGYDIFLGDAYGAATVIDPNSVIDGRDVVAKIQRDEEARRWQEARAAQSRPNVFAPFFVALGGAVFAGAMAAWAAWALMSSYMVPTAVSAGSALVAGFIGFRYLNPVGWYVRLRRWWIRRQARSV